MKNTLQLSTKAEPHRVKIAPTGLLLGLLALSPWVCAQEVVAPLTKSVITNSDAQADTQGGGPNGGPPASAFNGLAWGPFTFHPHFLYRFLYGDGIQASPGKPSTTAINSFVPGLLTEFGTHWTLDYTPSWNEYSNSSFRDTVDQVANLTWQTTYQDWILSLAQTYSLTTQPLVETGQQTREKDYITQIHANYQLASQLLLETTLLQSVRLTEGFNDTRDWSAREYVHFQLSPRLTTGIGTLVGYTSVSKAPAMFYIQLLGRVVWHPVELFSFQLEGGFENRAIRQKDSSDLHNPIISASIEYRPVETTTVSLSADRTTTTSYFSNQVVENSHVVLGLQQRLFGAFYLSANVGYQNSSFRGTGPAVILADRKDDSWTFGAKLQTTLVRRVTAGLTYQTSHNESNVAGFGFSSNQIGLELGYRY